MPTSNDSDEKVFSTERESKSFERLTDNELYNQAIKRIDNLSNIPKRPNR